MQLNQRLRRALALFLSATMMMSVAGGVALAKRGNLDDKTRPDDDRSSNSGSSSSGSGSSGGGSSGSGGGGGGASAVTGGRDGYDRVSDPKELSAGQKLEQSVNQQSGSSLDGRMRNDRDFGDRFR